MQKTKPIVDAQLLVLILFFILFMPLIVFSQKEFYIPKALLIPLHDQKHQLHTSIGMGNGYDINLSYTLSNHFAVFATGTSNKGTKKRTGFFGDRYNIVKDDYALSYGIGYFKKQEGSFKSLETFETYIGYGKYKVDNYWYFTGNPDLGSTITQAHYWNIFWQFNMGKKFRNYEFAVASRLSYLKYQDMQFYDTHPNVRNIKKRYENLKGVNLDPVFCFGLQWKKIFINVQAGPSIPLIKGDVTQINAHIFPDRTLVVKEYNTKGLVAFIGRISLQYSFNFSNKKNG